LEQNPLDLGAVEFLKNYGQLEVAAVTKKIYLSNYNKRIWDKTKHFTTPLILP